MTDIRAYPRGTLATDGAPSARVLILKNVDARGWQFAAHGSSPKDRDLAGHPAVALTFYWPQQARQVRVRGPVQPESAQESAADFLARSAGSPDLVIPEWTLYTVRAEQVEFWQADKQRKHTRLRYERHGDTWTRGQLWP